MSQQEVVELMLSSRSETEWEKNCDTVKQRCNGYPQFWYMAIVASGLANRVANSWGGDAEIHITTYSRNS